MKLAVLLTCFNRKEKTLNCIKKLLPQLDSSGYKYKIFICDDKSNDGSYESLKKLLPKHIVLQSPGNFYWSKGMYTVMYMAAEQQYDYYLMINDDVDFFDNALSIMLSSYYKAGKSCGIVGSTVTKTDESLTYGGRMELRDPRPIAPQKNLIKCRYANWNCFLIDHSVIEKIGCIDGKYRHGYGDYDYSMRMGKKGIPIYTAVGSVGYCEKNKSENTFRDKTLTRRERLKKLTGPKGVPFFSYFRYHIKNEGIHRIPACLYGYSCYIIAILLKKEI